MFLEVAFSEWVVSVVGALIVSGLGAVFGILFKLNGSVEKVKESITDLSARITKLDGDLDKLDDRLREVEVRTGTRRLDKSDDRN